MNKKLDIHNFWRSNIFIILMFVVMSVMSGIFMYHSHFFGVQWDLEFHLQRFYEYRQSIINGDFNPVIAINKFDQSGSAVMGMYPKINLLPVTLLSLAVKSYMSVNSIHVAFMLRNFVDLIIAYFACFSYKKDKKIGFLFSVAYVLSTLSLCHYYVVFGVGTLSAISFLPLVFFGALSLLKCGKWIELSIGMSAIIFSHILSAGVVVVFLSMLFLANFKQFKNCTKFLSLTKAVMVTALMTSVFWIPFMIINITNKLNIPNGGNNINGQSFNWLISSLMDNNVSDCITLASLVGLILAIVNYKKLDVMIKKLFWIAILFIIMISNIFPWSIASHTFINYIQFPSRLYFIPQVILIYIFADNVISLSNKFNKSKLSIVLITLAILTLQMGGQESIVSGYSNRPELTTPYNLDLNFVLKKNSDFNNILNSKFSNSDYYPQSSMSYVNNIRNHIAVYSKNKQLSVELLGNGKFIFTSKKSIKKLSLPFLHYNGINYQVKLDGKTVKGYPNKNALMTINNVHKGKHHVQIIVHKTKAEIASYILSLIGLLILLGTIFKNFLKKRKNK